MQNRFKIINHFTSSSLQMWHLTQSEIDFFINKPITKFEWSKKYTVFTAFFANDATISFTLSNNKVTACCSCSTKKAFSRCIHDFITDLTIKYFWDTPSYYRTPSYNNAESQNLVESLIYGACRDEAYISDDLPMGIVVCLFSPKSSYNSYDTGESTICFIKDKQIITPSQYKDISKLVSCYINLIGTNSNFDDYEERLIANIAVLSNDYPIYISEGESFYKVEWDPAFKPQRVYTEVEIADNNMLHVSRRAAYAIADGSEIILDSITSLGDMLFLDRNTKRLGIIDHFRWNYSYALQCDTTKNTKCYDSFPITSDPFFLSTKTFNAQKLLTNDMQGNNLVFKHNNITVQPSTGTPNVRIEISQFDSQFSTLQSTISFGTTNFSAWNTTALNGLMRTRESARKYFDGKMIQLWKKAYISASCAQDKKELVDIITEASAKIAQQSNLIDIKKRVETPLKNGYKKVQNLDDRTFILIHEQQLYHVTINHTLYWYMYALPQIIFNKYKETHYFTESRVDTNELYPLIGPFRELLHKYGITLYIDSKEVKTAKLDITINTNRSEVDWFELHPEIYYEGKKVSDTDWQCIVQGNGIWRKDDEVLVIDSQACTILNLLSRWMSDESPHGKKSIVQIPRLRIFDLFELRKNGAKLKVSDADEKLLHNLSHFTAIATQPLPKKLNCVLRDYQKEGYYWLSFLYQHQFGACLADDMGLGKTVQAIAFLAALKEGILKSTDKKQKPHLIVVPTSLVFNWINEIKNFYPHFTVKEYTTTKSNCTFDDADIFITTYDIARRDTEKLSKIPFNVIIFDEAQSVKNITAKRTSAARILHGNFKLCITGTPLENHIGEYYSIMDLALPGLLPEYATFKSEANSNGAYGIVQRTRPFILRRTKEIIAGELPEKIESDIYFYMTEKQRSLYTRITQEVRNEVAKAYQHKTKGQASIVALTALLRLRQICISPELVIPAKKAELTPKLEYVVEQLPNLIEEGHAALVFSQFTKCLDLVETELQKTGVKYARIDGEVTLAKRKTIIESFQKDKTVDVLLMSLKTGGVGLNLTRASYVFHIDPWWNAAAENQASDRAYRIGQKNTVIINRLLMHHSIEEKMLTLKKTKQELFTAIVDGAGEKTSSALSQADFNFLLE